MPTTFIQHFPSIFLICLHHNMVYEELSLTMGKPDFIRCSSSHGLYYEKGLFNYYTIFSKIANFTRHLSQEYDDIGWL